MKAIATISFILSVFQQVHAFNSALREMTREVLEATVFSVNFTGQIDFTDGAINQIVRANNILDRSFAARRAIYDDWHFYNEQFEDASRRLIQLKEEIVTTITGSKSNPGLARRIFGQALHTLQEFYSHTNWVELGNTAIETKLGREIIDDPDPNARMCSNGALSDFGETDLTSSYRWHFLHRVPDLKCSTRDLDKENEKHPDFPAAKALALEATYDYMDQVVEAFGGNEVALRRFVDRDVAVIFLVDTTESMRNELEGVKTAASGIIAQYSGDQIGRYILISFHDGEGDDAIRSITTTADPDEFLAAVDALVADSDGLGTCREAGWTAMNKAVDLVVSGSKIYFWSDAAQKRNGFFPLFPKFYFRWYLALFKHTRVRFILTGNCLPFGSSYRGFNTIARIMGGSVIIADENEVGSLDYSV
jgi:hypothetical protein